MKKIFSFIVVGFLFVQICAAQPEAFSERAFDPDLRCNATLPTIIYDRNAHDYSPNPFTIRHTLTNVGSGEAKNGTATISFNSNDLTLISPATTTQSFNPATIKMRETGVVDWILQAKPRVKADSVRICISYSFDDGVQGACCYQIFIPEAGPIITCSVTAPEIKLDATWTRYTPMPFSVTADIRNDGMTRSDSLYATIGLKQDLMLYPMEKEQTIKLASPPMLLPGQHATVEWLLVHPISLDRKDYDVPVSIRERNADSVMCATSITFPAIDWCQLRYDCNPASISLSFDSSAGVYKPEIIPARIAISNMGGTFADSARATIVLPNGVDLIPASQPRTKYFNPMRVEPWKPSSPPNELSWDVRVITRPKKDTSFTVQFYLEAVGPNGLPLPPESTAMKINVPGLRALLRHDHFRPDSLHLNSRGTGYEPNPFTYRVLLHNIGWQPLLVKQAYISYSNLTGTGEAQILSPNPLPINQEVEPQSTLPISFEIYAEPKREMRLTRFVIDLEDVDETWMLCSHSIVIPGVDSLVSVSHEQQARTFSLSQNYPNPFSESTTILLRLLIGEGARRAGEVEYSRDRGEVKDSPMRGEVVTFKCYDLFGREVLDLSEEARSNSSVTIRASQLPCAGMYFYRLTSNGISQTKIMVVR